MNQSTMFRQSVYIHWVFITILFQIACGQAQVTKPSPKDGVNYAKWLLGDHKETHAELPGYDGWYNNLARPDSGAIDRPLLRRSPAAYKDGTYLPNDGNDRPNPFTLSDELLSGDIGTQSRTGKSAFLVFFGQQIVEEILDSQRPACPPEYFNIPIPEKHKYREQHTEMPLLRTRFDHRTGLTPNNPRQQLNEITPYLDGGLIYGITKQWSDQLRTYSNGTIDENGRLASSHNGLFPEYNDHRLPMANPPPPFHHAEFIKKHETKPVSRFFKLGNPRGNENTFLLTFGILWFRWHNFMADNIRLLHPEWKSEKVFNEARKWVIATQQHVVVDLWLPTWLSKPLDPYTEYDASIDPQIDQFFQAAAFRFGHTLVTPGVYVRDYNRNNCSYDIKSVLGTNAVRTCNAFWRPQDAITAVYNEKTEELVDIDRLLMGMASQLCEAEDHTIVEDLRGNVFGPLEFPRRDLMAINVQRGRDHGLPDFNSARIAYGLPPYTTFTNFTRITTATRDKLEKLYNNNTDNIDTWIGGILETADGPGELFETIIIDQFRRIRDADRFWYENKANGLFTDEEIKRIKEITVYDIIMTVTKLDLDDIQKNVFQVPLDAKEIGSNCKNQFTNSMCTKIGNPKNYICFHLPILNAAALNENCTQGTTYDYFSQSEVSFIITFSFVGTCIVSVITLAYYLRFKKNSGRQLAGETQTTNDGNLMFVAKEIVGPKIPSRTVLLNLKETSKQIEVTNPKGILLRGLDCSNGITYQCVLDKPCLIVKALHGYDLVIVFQYERLRANFIQHLNKFATSIKSAVHEKGTIALYKLATKSILTKKQRQQQLEMFFRVVVAQAFGETYESEEINQIDDTSLAIAETELTLLEFAEALSMEPESSIALCMFNLVDKDKNKFISFREFIDFITTFSKGNATDKATLLFKMYDINKTGKLSVDIFKQLTGSFLGRSKAEINSKTLDDTINSLLKNKQLDHKQELTLDDFLMIFGDDFEKLNNVNINLTVGNTRFETAKQMVDDIYGTLSDIQQRFKAENVQLNKAVRERNVLDRLPFVRYIERYSKEIFWITLYTLVLLAIFFERAYYYTVEREVGGLRQIAGYGVSITRGAASAMMFTYSSMLVTMCRNLITKLRDTVASHYFPFDFCVDFHKYIGYWAVFFTLFHIIGHALNFYHISTQTSDDLTCLFRNYFHATHEIPKFHYWCWGTITGVTGILLTLILVVMVVFAQSCVRRSLYNYFWYTHALYPIFFILMILHGTGRLVQQPIFYYFFLGPIILFTIDQCISLSRKKTEIIVQGAKILASNVTMLIIEKPKVFSYKAGQWIRVACLDINAHEYHPFTLSSSPDEEFLSVHIRAVGPWTRAIRQLYENALMNDKPLPKLYIDGPFGEGHQDWSRYDVSILVASGIGVTPFASILKDIVYRSNLNQLKGKKVYFMWISRSQKQFEWLVELLKDIEDGDKHNIINPHIYITEFYEKYDLRTIMLYIFEKYYQKISNKSMFTNLQAVTHFGRPKFDQFFKTVQSLHQNVNKIGVFSCGSATMISEVSSCCNNINKSGNEGILEHYSETF